MTPATTIDLGHVARDLNLRLDSVSRTLELLDEGNTVPFITRYRKDQTGGLDEEQIRDIQFRVGKIRQLAERKATILKTIEAQGKLTPELAAQIEHANTPKRLEDLYLPFKPKKQTLATVARERGLEPLAVEIYEAHETANDMVARAATFISADKELHSVEDVLNGVRHLIAERFSENAELRGRLRRIFQRSGRIVCTKVEPAAAPQESGVRGQAAGGVREGEAPAEPTAEGSGFVVQGSEAVVASPQLAAAESSIDVLSTQYQVPSTEVQEIADEPTATEKPSTQYTELRTKPSPAAVEPPPASAEPSTPPQPSVHDATSAEYMVLGSMAPTIVESTVIADATSATVPFVPLNQLLAAESAAASPTLPLPHSPTLESPADSTLPSGRLFEAPATALAAPDLKKKKKKKKKVIGEHAFKDYYDYTEPLSRVPPHRVLAINRGERAHAIRVKIDADVDAMLREAEEFLIWSQNPHADFLRGCVRDSLTRLIIPSLEREIRRELTDRSEEHAVEVFIRNLRKLLLQPPTRNRRVLAIDPGFKSGSKMVALDEFGNVLAHAMIFVIGKDEERRKKARGRLADMVKQHNVSVIAIGNGTGCRETEQLVADCLADELKDRDVAYVVVNEAGASIYSTSPLGREELPQFDALQRGAISIGRRLLDPLSEMVKIHPANLGVGLYQHDIKAKHLKDSLDGVVESCVNFVGVDVNSASPALLRYVSGMNALTARRVYEYRREKGPFKNREELKQVPGFGEQTFVQAAGFLKVIGGENPLDATWIHPESYDIARRVLDSMGCDVAELAKAVPAPAKEEEKKVFAAELVEEPGVGSQEPEVRGQGPGVGGQESEANQDLSTEHQVPSAVQSNEPALAPTSDQSSAPTPTADPSETLVMSPDELAALAKAAFDSEAALQPSPTLPPSHSPTPEPPAAAEPPATVESPATVEPPAPSRSLIAERASAVNIDQLAGELNVGTHLLEDILVSLTRPALDPRDNLPPPVFRRGIMKLEDLSPGMELSGTVLNVVDFGVFVDIGLSDSGLVHISRLADRFIRDPHEVVGVGDVLKVWVVDVDKSRRRVSLTAIAPGSERPQPPPRERQPRQQQPRPPRQQQGGPAQQQRQAAGPAAGVGAPAGGGRPPRQYGGGGGGGGGGRRDQRGGGRERDQYPKTIERPPTKPKKVKPLTKAMEDGKEPLRSFSDLQQLFDKKKQKPKGEEPPPPATSA
jgi:uncharacterized protein